MNQLLKYSILLLALSAQDLLFAQIQSPVRWKAQWIEPGYTEDTLMRPCPIFKKNVVLPKAIRNATLSITSHGVYHITINKEEITSALFTPGWTSYHKRLQFQVYDVKKFLRRSNSIEVVVGSGWYHGTLGLDQHNNLYGKSVGLLAQLEVQYTDGSTQTITSDSTWQSAESPIRYAEWYNGETVDTRYRAERWYPARQVVYPLDNLTSTISEPVTRHEIFPPVKIMTTPAGDTVADFGQNIAGWVRLQGSGVAGDTVRIDHAEVLDPDGNFYTTNLRTARAQDQYILNGPPSQLLEPHFTYHGFRYARLKGLRNNNWKIEAVAVYSDLKKTGSFECSNPFLNKLQHNIVWSQNGNFVDIPTDCPQRDERLGWTGDAMAFCATAAFNRDVQHFFTKWLADVAADQLPSGAVPQVVPNTVGDWGGAAGWGDAATIVPWTMYEVYDDTALLLRQYPSMLAWVNYIRSQTTGDLWNKGFHFGDWLSFRSEGLVDRSALTDVYLIAQAFYAHSTQLLINAARVLGKSEDITEYTALLEKIKSAFQQEYLTPNNRLVSGTQTAYVLALQFDLVDEVRRPALAKRLVDNIASYRFHLTSGFLGTPYICHVLSRFGYTDVAYKLLLQDTYPSWLYPVNMGATTIWERWDGIKPDGSFQTAAMTSFNHYSYGSVGAWMYQHILGIRIGAPGYRHIIIQPEPGGGLTWAKGHYDSRYGRIAVSWRLDNNRLSMDVSVPTGTTAEIVVPAKNGHAHTKHHVGPGTYHFTSKLPQ